MMEAKVPMVNNLMVSKYPIHFFNDYTDRESIAWVKLGDTHYSVTENGSFEVCVSASSHVQDDNSFTVWLHIEGDLNISITVLF